MRTFEFDFKIEVRAVVPESFLQGQLDAAADDDHTPFQKQLLDKHNSACEEARGDAELISAAGDEFLIELLVNGLRKGLRGHAVAMLESSAIGGSVAPVQCLERTALKPELDEAEDTVS